MKLTKSKLKQFIREVIDKPYVIRTPDGNIVKSFSSRELAEKALDRGDGGKDAFLDDTTQGEYK